jgi:Ni/Fe-hydrogenase subunit HybB-like protein
METNSRLQSPVALRSSPWEESKVGGSPYATGPVTKAPAWHGLVAWDMLFNGMTTGLFLVAALSELAAPEVFTSVAKTAYPVAFVLLLVDLLCLVLDLGDPLRFHHMLRVFKPSSPMSLGTWCLTIYSLPLTVAAAISLLPGGWMSLEWVRRLAVIVGLLPALGSAVYKGVLLSISSQPGWKDARWLGGYLTNSALVLGCAEMLVLSVLMKHASAAAILRPALGLLLVLNMIPLCLLFFNLRTTLSRIYTRRELYGVVAFSLGGGVLIPLFLLFVVDSLLFTLSAVMFILLGSLVIRFVIIKLPHASA